MKPFFLFLMLLWEILERRYRRSRGAFDIIIELMRHDLMKEQMKSFKSDRLLILDVKIEFVRIER